MSARLSRRQTPVVAIGSLAVLTLLLGLPLLWGIVFPGNYTLVALLPFIGLGWLCAGGVAAAVLRARHPAMFGRLGRTWTSS